MNSTIIKSQILLVSIIVVIVVSIVFSPLISPILNSNQGVFLIEADFGVQSQHTQYQESIESTQRGRADNHVSNEAVANHDEIVPMSATIVDNDLEQMNLILEERRIIVNQNQLEELVEEMIMNNNVSGENFKFYEFEIILNETKNYGFVSLYENCVNSEFFNQEVCKTYSIQRFDEERFVFQTIVREQQHEIEEVIG